MTETAGFTRGGEGVPVAPGFMDDGPPRAPVSIRIADGPRPTAKAFDASWERRTTLDLPDTPWDLSRNRWVWLGEIDCETVAGAAVEALARGVGLSIRITVEGRIRQRLLEDLHALGEVIPPGRPGQQLALDDDQRALIEALVSGTTLTQAASDLNWSRRTANRRMAEVRAALEADTTAEAITAWATRRRTC